MQQNYEKFLIDFDNVLKLLFDIQKKYIKCKRGCCKCCQKGDYPISQLEFSHLTNGFLNLPTEVKSIVQKNIKQINLEQSKAKSENFEYACPFLINRECCVYEYRPIICRTFGLCYWDDTNKYVRLPDCVNSGLNYSEYYDKASKTLNISDVPMINLRIDRVLNSELAKKYNIDCGEIRPMKKWFL